MSPASPTCLTPVSFGELIDKITILTLKGEYIANAEKLVNVKAEREALEAALPISAREAEGIADYTAQLLEINRSLWHIEDEIRDCERRQDFGERFIALARAVYMTNDQRAAIKRSINLATGSGLIEEKSYQAY